MKNKTLRGGVIGLGKMGLLHSAIINVLKKAELSAICEANNRVRLSASSFMPKVNFYKDYKKMLIQEGLDFVFITTPSFSHPQIAKDCIKHDCHIFIEKPLSINAATAKPLIRALKKRPRVTMVGYMMRYLNTFSRAKEILDKKILGKIISFQATTYVSQLFNKGKGWRYSPEKSGGGVIITQGSHAVDLIYWFFNIPQIVSAQINLFYSKKVEDFGHLNFGWKNGLTGWLDCSWSVDNHRLLEIAFQINGENGTLSVNDDMVKLYLRKKVKSFPQGWTLETKAELFSGVAVDIGGPQFTKEDEAFIKAIINKKKVANDVFSAYQVQKIVDGAYRSAKKQGKPIWLNK
jgi:predicted dehydrogenase